MTLLTATSGTTNGILPNEIGALITEPVRRASVAMNVGTVVTTVSNEYRVPVVVADAGADWVAEGEEITPTDATLTEIVVRPSKVAGLSVISRELATDSSPSAQQLVGEGLAQSLATKIDAAFFANTTANGPAGLASLADVQLVSTSGGITDLDPFAEAISKGEDVGAVITSFVAKPADVLNLARLKKLSTGSNEPLLQADPTQPSRRQILGVPVISSPPSNPATSGQSRPPRY